MNELFVPAGIHSRSEEKIQSRKRPFTGGPRPSALIITCSDCTLDGPLSHYFEQQPVFLLRTFGNNVAEFLHAPDELIEALEEAVCWWKVPSIIVCGHSECSAMQRPLPSAEGDLTGFQAMLRRVGHANQVNEAARRHAREQLSALRSYPFIENALHEGQLELSTLFYIHMSGLFLCYDETRREYRPLI